MKKILSLTFVLAMVMSMGITTAFAAGNWEGGTKVTYTATGAEEWTVTVPATLAPGAAGDVTAAGTWGSNRKLVVAADENVVLKNSINAADTKTLTVTFDGINLVGDNNQDVSETKQVSVAAMPADALFGTWRGTFYYDVEMVDNVELITFYINGIDHQAVRGMTWGQWLESDVEVDDGWGGTISISDGYYTNGFYILYSMFDDEYYIVEANVNKTIEEGKEYTRAPYSDIE